jgi:hypothetical protein
MTKPDAMVGWPEKPSDPLWGVSDDEYKDYYRHLATFWEQRARAYLEKLKHCVVEMETATNSWGRTNFFPLTNELREFISTIGPLPEARRADALPERTDD